MRLQPGKIKTYGIPYQGSKTTIINKLARFFPNADNFYDLFGGGFSVSHYILEHRRKSYAQVYYNELRPGLCELIQDAINGKYNYDVFKPEWISREQFFESKESDAYVKILWSFGNNGNAYLFGKDIYQEKKSMHMAVVFNELDDFFKKTFKISEWPNDLTITGKRLYLRAVCRSSKRSDLHLRAVCRSSKRLDLLQLQQLERLEQLQRLQQLERLKKINFTNLDYRAVLIKPNSVIYCDIPYQGTGDYGSEFDHKAFFDWAHEQASPVFISEYDVKDPRFTLLKSINHRTTFSSGKIYSGVIENLYGNKAASDVIANFKSSSNAEA